MREAIVAGELSVGTELPTEKELTEQFQVSRSTVREALRIIQSQGLLSGGDTVSTARPRVSADQTSASASVGLENALRMRQVPLKDLIELRLLLEGFGLCHGPKDAPSLEQARDALSIMGSPDIDVTAFHQQDVRFHVCLAATGGNRAVSLVMSVLREAIAGPLRGALEALADPAPVLRQLTDEHAEILTAVEADDPERAAALVRDHIWGFYLAEMADA